MGPGNSLANIGPNYQTASETISWRLLSCSMDDGQHKRSCRQPARSAASPGGCAHNIGGASLMSRSHSTVSTDARRPFLAHERPLFFAHRGGSALAPENTLVAFERGVSFGAD